MHDNCAVSIGVMLISVRVAANILQFPGRGVGKSIAYEKRLAEWPDCVNFHTGASLAPALYTPSESAFIHAFPMLRE